MLSSLEMQFAAPTGGPPPPKVALLVHGHPDYSAGGAEMAAYSLYKGMAARHPEGTHLVSWIAPDRLRTHSRGLVSRVEPGLNEWLYHSGPAEWIYGGSASRADLHHGLISFLKEIDPDVIHFHHFLGFGMDAIRLVRLAFPRAKLVMTLHEYLAICRFQFLFQILQIVVRKGK